MNQSYLIGLDEVGRGCLAGPMVICATALPTDAFPEFIWKKDSDHPSFTQVPLLKKIRDSKKVSQKIREQISDWALHRPIIHTFVEVSNQDIDIFGLADCTRHAVLLALYTILTKISKASIIYLDGNLLLPKILNNTLIHNLSTGTQQLTREDLVWINSQNMYSQPKADDTYFSVALASILSKVQRDNFMGSLHEHFPNFNWKKNKGYGTKEHREVIQSYPTNPYLRQSFLTKIVHSSDSDPQLLLP